MRRQIFLLAASLAFLGGTPGPPAFEHIETVPLQYEWAANLDGIAYAQGRAYFVPPGGYSVVVYDVGKKRVEKTFGGRGGGPGEFERPLREIFMLDKKLAVPGTQRIDFFDLDGRFLEWRILKTPVSHMADLRDGRYLVGTSLGLEPADVSKRLNIGILKEGASSPSDFGVFGNSNTIRNILLAKFVFDADHRHVVIGQTGSNVLRFHDRSGKLLKKIELSRSPDDIEFDGGLVSGQLAVLARERGESVDDYKVPTSLIVRKVAVQPNYTLVLGHFKPAEGTRRLALVEHGSWQVSYHALRSPCKDIAVGEGKLACLSVAGGVARVELYHIKID